MPRPAVVLRLVALVGTAIGPACGPASPGSRSGGDGAVGDGTDGGESPGTPELVASNGVPIPPRDPRDSCGGLGLVLTACALGDACPVLPCNCPGVASTYVGFGCVDTCLTAVDCNAWCALGSDRSNLALLTCQTQGLCRTDQDCAAGSRCFLTPGETLGSCSNGASFSDCLTDDDCSTPGGCVVEQSRHRSCWSGGTGMLCNRDGQCAAGQCLLQAGKFAGVCTEGRNGENCWADADCQPGLKCMHGPVDAICSDGGNGSPCITDADCQPTRTCLQDGSSVTGSRCSSVM